MEDKKHHPLIRTIYLYLFALVGLALLTIGTVRFVDMGLKAFVFTQAEDMQRLYQGPGMPYPLERIEKLQEEEGLSEEEKATIKRWLADYEDWEKRSSQTDPVTAQRHRDASTILAMILVGLPLYLFHWRIISRETKGKE